MLDADKHLLAAEYLIGSLHPTRTAHQLQCPTIKHPLSPLPTLFSQLPLCSATYQRH